MSRAIPVASTTFWPNMQSRERALLSETERNRLQQQIRKELIRLARQENRPLIAYSDLGSLRSVKLDIVKKRAHRNFLLTFLRRISTEECSARRPLLSAIVVNKRKKIPGEGFFNLAHRLKKYDGKSKDKFWKCELDRIYRYNWPSF